MLNSDFPEQGAFGPDHYGGSPVGIWLYVEDVASAFERATDAGAEVVMPPREMFWGDRMSRVEDPFGIEWSIASKVEEVPPDEMAERQKRATEEWGD